MWGKPNYIFNDTIDIKTHFADDLPQKDIAAVMPITPKNGVYGGASGGKSESDIFFLSFVFLPKRKIS